MDLENIWSSLKHRLHKYYSKSSGFGVEEQLTFIKQFESYRGASSTLQPRNIIQKMQIVYARNYGEECIQCKVCKDLYECMTQGKGMTYGMWRWFDDNIVLIYECANRAGEGANTVNVIISMLDKERKLKLAFIKSLMTPSMILLGSIALLFANGAKIMPIAKDILGKRYAPTQEMILLENSANYLIDYWMVPLVVVIGLVAFIKIQLSEAVGEYRNIYIRTPVVRIPFLIDREFETSKYLTLMSMVHGSGLSMLDTVRYIGKHCSKSMRFYMRRIELGIKRGEDKAGYFARGMLSDEHQVALDMLVEQGAGDFADALKGLAATVYNNAELSILRITARVKRILFFSALIILAIAIVMLAQVIGVVYVGVSTQ